MFTIVCRFNSIWHGTTTAMLGVCNDGGNVTKNEMIIKLIEIKLSIIENATDVLWMRGSMSGTVCEELDAILESMGVDNEELQSMYENKGVKSDV